MHSAIWAGRRGAGSQAVQDDESACAHAESLSSVLDIPSVSTIVDISVYGRAVPSFEMGTIVPKSSTIPSRRTLALPLIGDVMGGIPFAENETNWFQTRSA